MGKKSLPSRYDTPVVEDSDFIELSWEWICERFKKAAEGAKIAGLPGKLLLFCSF
jgi:hypothetical protein